MKMNVGYFLVLCLGLIRSIGCSGTTRLFLYESYIQAELRGTVRIPVSWKQGPSATLTISQEINGTKTEVFKSNETAYVAMNNWKSKVSVAMANGTDISWVNVTLANISLEDEGVYIIKVREEDSDVETPFNTGRFRIYTFALPIYMNIVIDREVVNEGKEVTFTCVGNVGRPPGKIALIQSFSQNYSHTVATVSDLDLQYTSTEMLPNGSYTLHHNFHMHLTRSDNGTTFRCQNIHFIPNLGIIESQETAMVFVNCEYQAKFTGSRKSFNVRFLK